MPLHLPPLTRREFLTRTIAGGVVLTLAPCLLRGEEPASECWALLSDPHIAADPALVSREINMTDHLRATAAEVAALSPAPLHVLVNGDCAFNHGEPGDYTQFVSLLQPMREAGLSIHCTLGNHDAREVFWNALPGEAAAPRPVASKHLSVLESPLANWILLDSLQETNHTPGDLGPEQLQWLAAALDARPGKPALVMVHHDMFPPANGKPAGLIDAEELLKVVQPRRQVKALLYGHTHTWRQHEIDGLHFINFPAVAYNFAPGEATGWVEAHLRADGIKLTLHAHQKEHAENGQTHDLKWRV
jgi:3',5'-cyclic AMP phosphodiesterase CpdA